MEYVVSGKIIYGEEFDWMEGYVSIEDGVINEIGEEKVESEIEGIIAPSFINAHTHIGDSVMKDVGFMGLEGLVGKNGEKDKILSTTPRGDLVRAMEYTIFDMIRTGTTMFADFREGGVVGVDALKEAMRNKGIDAKIFGRPLPGVEEGWTELLSNVHGIGISTTKDHDFRYLSDLASETQKKDKQFAIHAGEENRSDIEDAIELHPDHLVHMCAATKKDLRIIADKGIPVVVCPRSNFVTGVAPPGIGAMMEEGITVGVGTDNVMLNAANMFSECECISKLFLRDDVQALKICTMGGANVLKEDSIGSIEEGKRANIMVINDESYNMHGVKDPISGVVRRARADDVLATIHEGVLTWKQG